MSVWVKICANTSLEDALLAAEAGVDAVGFVFAASPRHVTPEQVAAIVPHLPSAIEKIGVFVDASLDEIEATVRSCGLTGVQLHFDAPPEFAAALRTLFGPTVRILRVVHFAPSAAEQLASYDLDANFDAVLVDSRNSFAAGGTGVAFDWTAARKSIFQDAKACKRIAAGGLNPENVAEAIAILRPFGVDVASGVEASPGKKDPAKVREFVARARSANRK